MKDQVTESIGCILRGKFHRDAIHMAIAPVIASCDLRPGDHVGSTGDNVVGPVVLNALGIVDPFVRGVVRKGDQFWLFLYPHTVTGMRHHWKHAWFKDDSEDMETEGDVVYAKEWLMEFAAEHGTCYGKLIDLGFEANRERGASCGSDEDLKNALNQNRLAFMKYWAVVTGRQLTGEDDIYFSCGC